MTDELYAPYLSFLGVPPEDNPPERARAAVLPIPYDLTTSYQPGARRGPLAILEASTHLETYDDELDREICDEVGIVTLPAVVPDTSGPEATMARIERVALEVVNSGRFLVGLGGDASPITLPASAVSFAPFGDSVFVVEEMSDPAGNRYLGARQQFVTLGPARGDQVAVLTGVKEGEVVVSAGAFKVRNGAAVLVNNEVQPGNEAAPRPEDT